MSSQITTEPQIELGPRAGKGEVLLVDEDQRDLRFHSLVLEERGFEILTCTSYEAGFQHLETEPFDFVLVSQGSKDFEGRRVLERAIQLDRHRAVLVVTRSIDMACYLEAMHMGAVDYIEKPVPPADLLRFVQTHIRVGGLTRRGGAA
jgi:two-component system phosphoglycerate transport system response regulator PgtA